jgi:anti-sigma B factor antagonist
MANTIEVVQLTGILDSTQAVTLQQQVAQALENQAEIVLIDLKDVTFVDSSGLGALVIALKAVRSANAKFYICSINEQVRILFELTSMDQVFEVFESREAFEQSVLIQTS